MKLILFALTLVFLWTSCQSPNATSTPQNQNLVQYVNPFIGTGAHGHTFPGATLPFGMVQLSPDTHLFGWDASSGYHYSDSVIYGFSHTHLSGTGIGDMGDIALMPYTGVTKDTLIATFRKDTEFAKAGYYKVQLDNFNVQVELTATLRTGMHRYIFPPNTVPKVHLDLAHILQANWGHKSVLGEVKIIDHQTIAGKRVSSGWAFDHPVYFRIQFSQPFQVIQVKDGNKLLTGNNLSGTNLKVWLQFDSTAQRVLLVKTGISSVDEAGAALNLKTENEGWDFDAIQQAAAQTWETALSKIEIQTNQLAIKTNFYTALYHSMLAPVIAQDIDGRYRGMDKQIHFATDKSTYYTVFSMWDTFRALHPLMNLIEQERNLQFIHSLLNKYKQGGVLPKWDLASNYTGTMVGYPSVAIIADALAKGVTDFDINLALEAAVVSSNYHPEITARLIEPRAIEVLPKHLDFIEKQGFIPADSLHQSVSYGLECAYYDWCIAQIAKHVNHKDIQTRYEKRAIYYKHYFDPAIGFMRGKLANGAWREPFDPFRSELEKSEFVEGNSWQWMWFVPHDIPEYIALMGGEAAFAQKLDELFNADSKLTGDIIPADISGLIGQYAHGNEPSHHVAYLYNYVGQPEKAQERLDYILQQLYTPTPDGISGNEDCGAMSAWYILNTLGFYAVCPGEPVYTIGRPLIDEATLHLPKGKELNIKVHNNSLDNKYVEKVHLNHQLLSTPFFNHQDIQNGGTLEFWMTANKK